MAITALLSGQHSAEEADTLSTGCDVLREAALENPSSVPGLLLLFPEERPEGHTCHLDYLPGTHPRFSTVRQYMQSSRCGMLQLASGMASSIKSVADSGRAIISREQLLQHTSTVRSAVYTANSLRLLHAPGSQQVKPKGQPGIDWQRQGQDKSQLAQSPAHLEPDSGNISHGVTSPTKSSNEHLILHRQQHLRCRKGTILYSSVHKLFCLHAPP